MQASKDALKLRLNFASKAPQHLADGRTAFQNEEYANATRSLKRAIETGAAYEELDQINLAKALLASKKTERS